MAKILQRWSSQDNRDQAGCVWGLMSIFDFRHGRSTRKLLGDRRRVSKLAVGSSRLHSHPTGKCQQFEDGEERNMAEAEVVMTSVKELMREEIFNGSKNQANEFDINFPQIDSEYKPHIKKNHKQRNRIYKTPSGDMDVSELYKAKCLTPENFHKVPEQGPSDTFNMELIIEELSRIHQKMKKCSKHDLHNDLDMPSGLDFSIIEAKLVEATKIFIEHRLSNGKPYGEEGKISCSKELMDALQTLSSNRAMFLKLLQDPNSVLVKQIQKLEDAQLKKVQILCSLAGSTLSEEKQNSSKSDGLVNGRHRKFFCRRKYLGSYPLGGNKNCQASSKIVILKPAPAALQNLHSELDQSHYTTDNKVPDERSTSQFSFTEIRRKLRHAVGKEKQGISPDGLICKLSSRHQNGHESSSRENVCWSSPNRDHFYTERFGKSSTGYKRSERVGKSKNHCSVKVNETSQNPGRGVSNIYIEAKKHLSEMLNNEDNNAEPVSLHLHKSLGRVLSLPEYNDSPCCSPRKYSDDIIITAETRLSPLGINNDTNHLVQENCDGPPSPSRSQPHSGSDNPSEKLPSLSTKTPCEDNEDYSVESECYRDDVVNPEVPSSSSRFVVIQDKTDLRPEEEETSTIISYVSTINSIVGESQNGSIDEVDDEANSFQCLKSDSVGRESLISSPTFCSLDVENPKNIIDKTDGPSPVSVLEPLFAENDTSPLSTKSRRDEKEIQPQQIHFEEEFSASNQGIRLITSIEDEESAYEYVEAVLLGSELNWDDYLLRWLSLYKILDPSVFDEVELFPSQSCHDQKLFFDCTNQVLEELCESYFGCFTGISYINQNIRPVPKRMDLIQEVWKRVEWYLFQRFPPHSPVQFIKKDMAKSGKWMNIQVDIEHIGIEMEETIFDELVDDTILSFADYISGCEFLVLPSESMKTYDVNL